MSSYLASYVVPIAGVTSDLMLFFRFPNAFLIFANALLIFRVDFIRFQYVITVFVIFFHRWYLLKTITDFFVTTYVTVVMVEDNVILVMS